MRPEDAACSRMNVLTFECCMKCVGLPAVSVISSLTIFINPANVMACHETFGPPYL